ncbi:hypothetical protein B9Z65_4490 [Elsinoe australis]|uniref:Uncharacterized protein n=1 Tax=Elsinoe australis TaxID=40998 RepID=A0A2P7Z2X9_9PEZI|nr:hypothetical protein B9Z65_4490 [Elsinoe australis]
MADSDSASTSSASPDAISSAGAAANPRSNHGGEKLVFAMSLGGALVGGNEGEVRGAGDRALSAAKPPAGPQGSFWDPVVRGRGGGGSEGEGEVSFRIGEFDVRRVAEVEGTGRAGRWRAAQRARERMEDARRETRQMEAWEREMREKEEELRIARENLVAERERRLEIEEGDKTGADELCSSSGSENIEAENKVTILPLVPQEGPPPCLRFCFYVHAFDGMGGDFEMLERILVEMGANLNTVKELEGWDIWWTMRSDGGVFDISAAASKEWHTCDRDNLSGCSQKGVRKQ